MKKEPTPYDELRAALYAARAVQIATIDGWNADSELQLWTVPHHGEPPAQTTASLIIVQRWTGKNSAGGFDIYRGDAPHVTVRAIAYALAPDPMPRIMAELDNARALIDGAIETHIYDFTNGDTIPDDCEYTACVKSLDALRADLIHCNTDSLTPPQRRETLSAADWALIDSGLGMSISEATHEEQETAPKELRAKLRRIGLVQ